MRGIDKPSEAAFPAPRITHPFLRTEYLFAAYAATAAYRYCYLRASSAFDCMLLTQLGSICRYVLLVCNAHCSFTSTSPVLPSPELNAVGELRPLDHIASLIASRGTIESTR
ncbi:hypothetical protein CLAIMM_12165, partial [Cladophialophora immunda]